MIVFETIVEFLGRRRQARQVSESRDRVAEVIGEKLELVKEENLAVSEALHHLVRSLHLPHRKKNGRA